MKSSEILGLNARSNLFSYKYNTAAAKRRANSKLATKRALKKAGVPVPATYVKFVTPRKVLKFDWGSLPDSFALKPNKGLGGEGILVAKKRTKDREGWVLVNKNIVTPEDLKLHAMDILEGAFSMKNVPDVAFVEEYIGRHKVFRKYAYRGFPDLRVIVFNKVPVMAMMRVPTKESGGRANLHQGAIAVGIDIATGITTKANWHGKYIKYKPGTERKLHGIKIPNWTKVLKMAIECSIATELDYLGADIVLHPQKGPMVLELNFQPGLSIQLANVVGLRKRLERVQDLKVRDAEHGVKISKILFAGRFMDRVKVEEGIKTLKGIERIKVYSSKKKGKFVMARIDTGAMRTSIDRELAEELGLLDENNILWKRKYAYRSSHGRQVRPVIGLTMRVAGRKIKTSASVANRTKMTTPLLIGRNDLQGFLVNPTKDE
jgi:alpha-L-glutamate ligase-like protein